MRAALQRIWLYWYTLTVRIFLYGQNQAKTEKIDKKIIFFLILRKHAYIH